MFVFVESPSGILLVSCVSVTAYSPCPYSCRRAMRSRCAIRPARDTIGSFTCKSSQRRPMYPACTHYCTPTSLGRVKIQLHCVYFCSSNIHLLIVSIAALPIAPETLEESGLCPPDLPTTQRPSQSSTSDPQPFPPERVWLQSESLATLSLRSVHTLHF